MYKCSKCGKKITEFDVNFSKNLFGKFDSENKCECAQCVANVNGLEQPKKRKPKTIFYLLPYIIIGVIVKLFSLLIAGETGLLDTILCLTILISLTPYIWSIIIVLKDLGVEYDEGYEVDVYRTTYNSSSDSFTTSKGKETYGGDNSGAFFAGLVYPVWGIFALMINLNRYNKYIKNNFSKKVIRAYEKAKKETESIVISKKECDLTQKKKNNYNEKCNQIKNKYGYLHDTNIISKKINKLQKPYLTLKSNKGTYYKWIDCRKNNYVLLDKRNNERIYNGKYFYYDDKNNAIKM